MAGGDLGYEITTQEKFTRGLSGDITTLTGFNVLTLIQAIPLPDTGSGDTKSSNILVVSADETTVPLEPLIQSAESPTPGELTVDWILTTDDGGRPVQSQSIFYRAEFTTPWLPYPGNPWTPILTTATQTGLAAGNYESYVVATNANGDSTGVTPFLFAVT